MTLKKQSFEIIVFCQAPADIPYVLKIYETNRKDHPISIFVINVQGMFQFLSNLNLNLERLVFIPYKLINLKHIYYLPREKKRINSLWKRYFYQKKLGQIYFFSRFEDWITASFIHRFSKYPYISIIYINHYDFSSEFFNANKSLSIKNRFYLFLLKYLTGANFDMKVRDKIPEFKIDNYSLIQREININNQLIRKYSFSSDSICAEDNNLLFFISPCDSSIFDYTMYNQIMIDTIILLKSVGYKIIVKGHPRIGIPKEFSDLADFELPNFVPGEFIEYSKFSICIGLNTNAICFFAKYNFIPTYSLINIFPGNIDIKNSLINFLNKQSNNHISFCNNLEDLKKISLLHLK